MQSYSAITVLAISLIALSPGKEPSMEPGVKDNIEKEWISLFNGKNLKGWHVYGRKTTGPAWEVKEGAIFFNTAKRDPLAKGSGDLVTDKEFENFHFKTDW